MENMTAQTNSQSSIISMLMDTLRGLALMVVDACQLILIPLCYICTLILLQPIKYILPVAAYKIEHCLYENCILIVSYWTELAGHQVFESGEDVDDILKSRRCIIIANHQRPSDIGIIMRALQTKTNFFRTTMWILDWVLQFLTFGWVCKGHDDFFLLQPVDAKKFSRVFGDGIFGRWEAGEQQLAKLKNTVKLKFDSNQRTSVILFPEGGFLHKRKSGSDRYCQRINHPTLNHITLPRIGAFEAALKGILECKENNENVCIVDMTLGYREPISICQHMFRFWHPKQKFVVHYRTFLINESFDNSLLESDDPNKLRDWLFARFTEKDHLLTNFYERDEFATPTTVRPCPPLPVLPYIIMHLWTLFILYLLTHLW